MAGAEPTRPDRPGTVAAWVDRAVARLVASGFPADQARGDAAVLGRAALGWDSARWIVGLTDPIAPESSATLDAMIARRVGREPVAYILGEREFFGRPFAVSPDVLIPRPETEWLVEAALSAIDERSSAGRPPAVLDVGTGSGCIAVTIALERPAVLVTGTDVSAAALSAAAANARRHGVGDRVTWRHAPLAGGAAGTVDVLVSNPPYVAEADRGSLPPDVRDFEPATALFGGPDGLGVLRALVPAAALALRPGGWLLVEIGAGQADIVRRLLTGTSLAWIEARPDLAGIPRVVIARRTGASI
jgi:release factor glutamine methyltransferase